MGLRRVLVATRGEGARRIMHACRDENIEPVVLTADADTPELALSNRGTICAPRGVTLETIAPAEVVRLADDAGCDSVHPGFQGLADRDDIAAAVEATRLHWVGPPAELVAALTDVDGAIALMGDFGIPIAADRGACAVQHIDIPVLADPEGQVNFFPEQCCTVANGAIPMIEESPADQISRALRMRLAAAAVLATRCLGYVGAGTLRFQIDDDGDFGFVSMSPHLQSAHAIAEEMTGVDLVRLQLRIAANEPTGLLQDHVRPRGHVIGASIHVGGPASGRITAYREPGGQGIHLDSAVTVGSHVTSPLPPAVRITVIAPHRSAAVLRLQEALNSLVIEGVQTDLPQLREIVQSEEFRSRRPITDAGGDDMAAWFAADPNAVDFHVAQPSVSITGRP